MKNRNCRPRTGTPQQDVAACRQDDRRAKHEIRIERRGEAIGAGHAACRSPRLMASRSAGCRRAAIARSSAGSSAGAAECGLPEHAVAGALGFRQQPDDAHAVRRDQQFLGAALGKDVEMAGDDVVREAHALAVRPHHRLGGKSRDLRQRVVEMIEIGECRRRARPHHHVEDAWHVDLSVIETRQPARRQLPRRQRVDDGAHLHALAVP